jgi:hypothetical protein
MSNNIIIKNKPRDTDKTTILKKTLLEEIIKSYGERPTRNKFLVIVLNLNQAREYENYFLELGISRLINVETMSKYSRDYDAFVRDVYINYISHIFIDECFVLDKDLQSFILDGCIQRSIKLFGIGTEVESPKTFKDYL